MKPGEDETVAAVAAKAAPRRSVSRRVTPPALAVEALGK
jgi:hypothetical protein